MLVSLLATPALGQDTIQAKFTVVDGCDGSETVFTNISKTPQRVGVCDFRWDFGDGNTSTDQFPKHNYTLDDPKVGQSFQVKLVVQSKVLPHEIDSVYGSVQIFPNPNPYFEWDVINHGNSQDVVIDSQATKDPTNVYQWSFANVYKSTDISPVFKSSEVGEVLDGMDHNFVLYLVTKEGCDATYSTKFNYNPLSVKDMNLRGLKMYPNPTTGLINLGQEYDVIQVLNTLGEVVFKTANSQSIDLNLPAGIYTLVGLTDGAKHVGQVVLK